MSNKYFSEVTDSYIIQYLETEDIKLKNKIFNIHIRPALEKLVENQIYVYGFFSIDDVDSLRKDALANLYELLPKFKPEKGTKGFSYFNVILKNWFFQKSRENSKRRKVEGDGQDCDALNNEQNLIVDSCEDEAEKAEFWLELYKTLELWRHLLTKPNEKKVLEAVIFLINHPDLVPIYNKKAIGMYIRDITNLNSKQVRQNLKKIKALYAKWRQEYYDNNYLLEEEDMDEEESW